MLLKYSPPEYELQTLYNDRENSNSQEIPKLIINVYY